MEKKHRNIIVLAIACAVVLAVATRFLLQVTPVFQAGFETGDLTEFATIRTWRDGVENGVVDVSTANVRSGSYSGHFTVLSSPNSTMAMAATDATLNADELHVEGWFYVTQPLTYSNNMRIYLIYIYGTDGTLLTTVGIRRQDSAGITEPHFVLWSRVTTNDDGSYTGGHEFGSTVFPSTAQWMKWELTYERATATFNLYVNGILEVTRYGTVGGLPAANEVQFGIYKPGNEPTSEYSAEVYGDDFAIYPTIETPSTHGTLEVYCYLDAVQTNPSTLHVNGELKTTVNGFWSADVTAGQYLVEGTMNATPIQDSATVTVTAGETTTVLLGWGTISPPEPQPSYKLRTIMIGIIAGVAGALVLFALTKKRKKKS